MLERGKFIIVEGVGGAGKGTQIPEAERYIQSLGHDVHITREPGGEKSAEEIRDLIFRFRGKELINADQQIIMFYTARDLWMKGVVIPRIQNGIHVLADRSYPSTAAYQGYGEGGNIEYIEKLSREVLGENRPDAIILLDVSAEEAQKRKVDKGGDPFDDEGRDYQERLVKGYREMAVNNWSGVSWYVVNGEQQIEDVTQDICRVLDVILKNP
jgi:dTMP kinase